MEQNFLDALISSSKIAIKAERRNMVKNNRHLKNKVWLESKDKKYNFYMFMRKSLVFEEDFSIGLHWTNPSEYISVSKSILMLRCQGPHDGKQEFESDIHHSHHLHIIKCEDIASKRFQHPSNRILTTEFSCFNEALWFFINKCGIIDIGKYIDLPDIQTTLY